ncbi:MAG: hypothetical protein WDN27_06030 [Candidatus Saccharibacteria bacterium]
MRTKRSQIILLAILVVIGVSIYSKQQAIRDWEHLRGYTAPPKSRSWLPMTP